MKCPKCRLINPDAALRCDCGYDFQSGKMEQSYFTTEAAIPRWIPSVLAIGGLLGFTNAVSQALGQQEGVAIAVVIFVVWGGLVSAVYSQMAKRKNWARIALSILAFPIGLTFLLSPGLKAYIRQRGGDI